MYEGTRIGYRSVDGTDALLQLKPVLVSLYQFFDNILFNLFFWVLLQVNAYPRLCELRQRGIGAVCPVDERDLEFSSVKFVGDDDAMTVSLQGSLSLGDE